MPQACACAATWAVVASVAQGRTVVVPVTIPGIPGVQEFQWQTTEATAEQHIERLRKRLSPDVEGLVLHTEEEVEVALGPGGSMRVVPSQTNQKWVEWRLLPGTLQAVAAQYLTPEEIFALEVEPWPGEDHAPVGIFLLQSPGRHMWRATTLALHTAWDKGAIDAATARLHVLVHSVKNWQPQEWKDSLGAAAPMLGGLHWCYGPNRFGRQDTQRKQLDNYFHKAFTMHRLAVHLAYTYIVSLDDDVLLPPSVFGFLLSRGPEALDRKNCGVLTPTLQNGVPSVEMFAEEYMSRKERNKLYRCFEESEMIWMDRTYDHLMPMPSPWNASEWYGRVTSREWTDLKGLHPVRANSTCQDLALELALPKVADEWPRWRFDHRVIVPPVHRYPYLCNNVYMVRTDLYTDVLERQDLQRDGGADEAPLNLLMKERRKSICFISHSFGLHPAYGSHHSGAMLEREAVFKVMEAEWGPGTPAKVCYGKSCDGLR
eukprot:gnl/TRDRNA2_/TRDRNA2_161157_c0_seq1.p1 gnl/TRDRNA2_/TRDRNA2_161157_c0~~gnl/TRDRNA2_/TRDRNA2_161157_c0_seq1.p1  ORF type:complete len:487 (+),score=71.21 gnl/TRDRNA2_/TRDRNA2_161157_c0_seq1:47-1507(+)